MGFALQGFKRTLLQYLDVTENERPENPAVVGMLCTHGSPYATPDRKPDFYLSKNCKTQYDQYIKNGETFFPDCDDSGDYKTKQCGVETGLRRFNETYPGHRCRCVDRYGAMRNRLNYSDNCETSLAYQNFERLTIDMQVTLGIRLDLLELIRISRKMEEPLISIFENIEKTERNCTGKEKIDVQMTRPDMPSICGDFERLWSQILKFNKVYTGSCENGYTRSTRKLRRQLKRIGKKILKKFHCTNSTGNNQIDSPMDSKIEYAPVKNIVYNNFYTSKRRKG